ncbi:right-handed parallel beta-helix repeat-containing protein [Archangium violaceum]|uniref:right-handed parallel beta-helix repeat-containing protein n=1 Tax=Archangium violaceum TaxID=83451 RepID=UPI00194ED3FB|nr:right-handed parallel beta-helix repeat-containing protein [Archangium violaceum]QRN98431.1 right-handed parallel beta-helix repeat-containing protein [Archangium violaceum]
MRIRWLLPVVPPAVLIGALACGERGGSIASGDELPVSEGSATAPQPTAKPPTSPPSPTPTAPTPGPSPQSPPPPAPPPPPEFSRILWVAPNGNDTAAGTERAPFRTVSKALSLLQPGEAVFLKTGTYTERLRLDSRDGAPGRYLTVKAAPGAKPVIKPAGSGTTLLDVRRAYWRVEGLTLDVAGEDSFAAFWRGAGAHHGILRGCTLKNGTSGAGVNVAERASDVLIEDNAIFNFQRSGDSHGVVVQTNSRNVVVRGNDIHHNSGDGVQCLGPEGGATEPGTPFDNLLVEDNDLHENRENGADIKTCTRVTLRGNRIWGHRRSASSAGEGVVVHLSARDITLEENEVRDNGRGINIGGVRQGSPPTHIVLRRNLVLDGYGADGNEGTGIRIDTAVNVKVHHNTVWNMPTHCLGLGNGDSGPSQDVEARNNIFGACAIMVRAGSARSGVSFDGNLYFSPQGHVSFRVDGKYPDLVGWRSATRWDAHSVEEEPGFQDAEAGDFRLGSASAARNEGLSLGQAYCGSAPDMGARESDCP